MGVRFIILTTLFGILFGILGFNLYNVQINKGSYYLGKVQARTENSAQLELRRGDILLTDRYGNSIPVALNKDYPVIYAVPKEIKDPKSEALALAPVIGATSTALEKILNNPQSMFRILVEKASDQMVGAVDALNLEGIYTDTKQYRYYPFGELSSQVIGFVGMNSNTTEPIGLYGVEKYYNDTLEAGNDINLTIDRNLQVQSEDTLQNLIKEQNATGGTIIIEEPTTGKILALANYPTFDPNAYSKSDVTNFLDPALQYTYEPGSVFKSITMSAGINENIIAPTSTYDDKGFVVMNGKTINNWDHKGRGPKTTMIRVLEDSLNTGAVWAEQQIGRKIFYDYVTKFGFGTTTGIDLPNEVSGSLNNLERRGAEDIDYASAAFGQGISVTPLQMINAYSAIANGGFLMRPYVNAELGPHTIRRVISESTAKQVIDMLVKAVNFNKVAVIPQFDVAGKTGTAQIPDLVHGGYTDKYMDTFIGIAPASNPRFVILVKLDNPDSYLAGESVVPAFRDLATFVLNYYNVAPDNQTNLRPTQ
ncbi:penicillin-binding protein 2 [Patescibacteria group bacterium]|nr:penicillin-binding protein 2 [Patescibacteria group bacterium]